jgi:hypothetical protein
VVSAQRWCKSAIAFQIQIEPLKERSQVEDPIATTLEHLDLVVQPFDKATVVALQEVIGDLLQVVVQGGKEALITL